MDFSRIFVLFIILKVSHSTQFKRLPKMVIFDLDHILWPFEVGINAISPFERSSIGEVVDSKGRILRYFPQVPAIFTYLKEKKILIGICSNAVDVEGSKHLMNLFGWDKYIYKAEIGPVGKDTVVYSLSDDDGIPLKEIIFFDDEVHDFAKLQMDYLKFFTVQVKYGVTMQLLKDSLKKFSDLRTSES